MHDFSNPFLCEVQFVETRMKLRHPDGMSIICSYLMPSIVYVGLLAPASGELC